MEVLDEFDSEFPQSVTFCQLISEEDFERQAATYTERSLRRLFRTLDRNPALAERVVRKGKQTECEQRGLLSFLWVREPLELETRRAGEVTTPACFPLGRSSEEDGTLGVCSKLGRAPLHLVGSVIRAFQKSRLPLGEWNRQVTPWFPPPLPIPLL